MRKQLSEKALSSIDGYARFKIGNAVCSVPYFNNKKVGSRATLRTYIGKGSPADIREETQELLKKTHVDAARLSGETLHKLLVDNNIGIECSGFVYHVLNAESISRNGQSLNKQISFVNCGGLLGKMRCSLRPAENCDRLSRRRSLRHWHSPGRNFNHES
jgi:hypothetical protein